MINLGGWIIMILSVGGVTGLFVWCIVQVFRDPEAKDTLHGFHDADVEQNRDE